jgi:3-oxoacyl-[acyl-carrier-protein] synthase-3
MPHYKNVALEARAHSLPPEWLTSSEIEQKLAPLYERLKLPEGRLELMTGVDKRGYWPVGTAPSTIATQAASKLIETNGIDPESIDLLIFSSVCRDFLEPASASVVHANLKLSPRTQIFDLSNACLGVLSATQMASNLIELGHFKRVLIVSGENAGPLLTNTLNQLENDPKITRKSIKKYIANLTIGSAGLAWLIGSTASAPHAPRIIGGVGQTDSSANHLCRGDGDAQGLMMQTDSEALLEHGIRLAKNNWKAFCDDLELENEQIDYVVGHQVGSAHERMVLGALELDKKKTTVTYPWLGNTGSAALPLTLDYLEKEHSLNKGDVMALLGIGSGLTSLIMGIEWNH